MKTLLLLALALSFSFSTEDELIIKMTKDISSVTTQDSGRDIKIIRVQEVSHKLLDDFTKTSRPCPPFCIQSTKINPNIDTIAELEIFKFMKEKITNQKGIIIDSRLKNWFEIETIPSAINIPYPIILHSKKEKIAQIFKLLGMKIENNGEWNFDNAKELTIFDNGLWCSQASFLIKGLLKYHYPSSKIHYYRDGLQGWKLLGLTTVVHKEIK